MPPEYPYSSSTTQTDETNGSDGDGVKDSFQAAFASLNEAKTYFGQMVSAKIDSAKVSMRLMLLYAFLGVFGIFIAITVAITATVLFVVGAAGGVGVLVGNRPWLGNLIVGVVFLLAATAGLMIGYPLLTGRLRKATVRKYEAMKQHQKRTFGHDAEEKARGATSSFRSGVSR